MGWFTKGSSWGSSERPTRCGRCAEILPDETMTYCPSCGTPFSRAVPTNSYIHLGERNLALYLRKRRFYVSFFSLAIFTMLGLTTHFVSEILFFEHVEKLASTREIIFYTYDSPEYPALENALKRQIIATAVQSFEDHFGIELRNFSIREKQFPRLLENYIKENSPLFQNPLTNLATWKNNIFTLFGEGLQNPYADSLPVVLTNIPIFVDTEGAEDIERRHLSPSGLISGLGHPALVVVSTYRMLNTEENFKDSKLPTQNDEEKIKQMGEFFIAHELGHALLGLEDYVLAKGGGSIRSPAGTSSKRENPRECLMHTDEGGGFEAWQAIRQRKLGKASACTEYEVLLKAFSVRAQAIAQLRLGNRNEARSMYDQALALLKDLPIQSWVMESWEDEKNAILPFYKRFFQY